MNTNDRPGIAIVKKIKLQNTIGKQIKTWGRIRIKFLIEKVGQFLGKSKELYIPWGTLITLTKFPTYFLKYGFLIYDSFLLLSLSRL